MVWLHFLNSESDVVVLWLWLWLWLWWKTRRKKSMRWIYALRLCTMHCIDQLSRRIWPRIPMMAWSTRPSPARTRAWNINKCINIKYWTSESWLPCFRLHQVQCLWTSHWFFLRCISLLSWHKSSQVKSSQVKSSQATAIVYVYCLLSQLLSQLHLQEHENTMNTQTLRLRRPDKDKDKDTKPISKLAKRHDGILQDQLRRYVPPP